jgi:penicillin-binding protein-related factor A (putative recombinase)
MDAWKNFFIQTVHQQGMLIEEQVNDTNPLYQLVQTPQTFQTRIDTVHRTRYSTTDRGKKPNQHY